jgi:hypothetical protein
MTDTDDGDPAPSDDADDGGGDRFVTAVAVAVGALVLFSVLVVVFAPSATPERGEDPPPVDWSFERVNESHVRITHAGGPTLDGSNVSVAVGQQELRPDGIVWNGSVAENDSSVVPAPRGRVVEVFWLGDRRIHHQMARWQDGEI